MIDGIGSLMTDAAAELFGRMQMTESGLGGIWRRRKRRRNV